MNYQRNIKLLYLIIFFHNLIPAYVIERLFSQERGMTVQMVVYCEIIYALTVIILEIPSGVVSDKWEKRKMISIGAFLGCFEFIALIFAYSFWVFAIVAVIAGISRAFTSGAWNALLYDSLPVCGESLSKKDFERILGRINAIDFTSAMIAALLGSFLAGRLGFVTNYQISAISMVLAFIFAILLKEPSTAFNEQAGNKADAVIKASFAFFKKNHAVTAMVIQSMLIAACVIYVDEFWQVYLDRISFPVIYFGIVSAALMTARIPGALLSAGLLRYMKPKTIIVVFSLLSAISIILTGYLQNEFGTVCFAFLAFSCGVIDPIVAGYIHHRINSDGRATIESLTSLIHRVLTIVIGICFGYAASMLSIFDAYIFIGIICLASTVIYAFTLPKSQFH